MKRVKNPYDKVVSLSRETHLLISAMQILEWDQETYMPHDAADIRAQQLEYLTSLIHKKKTSSSFDKALSLAEKLDLDEEKKAALREWRKDFNKAKKLPISFEKAFSNLTSKAMTVWRKAKADNSFKTFRPYLEKIVHLCRKKADYLGYQAHPYDALLDLFEPDMTVSRIEPLFTRLQEKLTPLTKEITTRFIPNTQCLEGHFSIDGQKNLSLHLLHLMGLEKGFSRLDESAHPFCMGSHPTDIRLTTHIKTHSFTPNFFAVMHEAGHALYDRDLPLEQFGTPLAEAVSLGIHESQSRFWETIIGHSRPFWDYFYPILQKQFPGNFGSTPYETFYRAIHKVQPSLIRIFADEVTYSLHIILRFKIEKMLIEGSLKVKELPEVWNAKMKEYLGILPPNDAEGCLQDIHWSMGTFGYFPTYALGNLYAASFFAAFTKQHPEWKEKVAGGHLHFIVEWLKNGIHRYGRRFSPEQLLHRVTHTHLSEEPYIHYLTEKYQRFFNRD